MKIIVYFYVEYFSIYYSKKYNGKIVVKFENTMVFLKIKLYGIFTTFTIVQNDEVYIGK